MDDSPATVTRSKTSASNRSVNMRANRRRDTGPEMQLRRIIHSRGLRYRCDLRFLVGGVAVRPDVVFTRRRVAVFVDGCFWHGCETHGRIPQVNTGYWAPKLRRNMSRDAQQAAALRNAGWLVIRAWEHDDPATVADRVEQAVRNRRSP
jgi:DNA mismatch endonuclease (patch repair protein)